MTAASLESCQWQLCFQNLRSSLNQVVLLGGHLENTPPSTPDRGSCCECVLWMLHTYFTSLPFLSSFKLIFYLRIKQFQFHYKGTITRNLNPLLLEFGCNEGLCSDHQLWAGAPLWDCWCFFWLTQVITSAVLFFKLSEHRPVSKEGNEKPSQPQQHWKPWSGGQHHLFKWRMEISFPESDNCWPRSPVMEGLLFNTIIGNLELTPAVQHLVVSFSIPSLSCYICFLFLFPSFPSCVACFIWPRAGMVVKKKAPLVGEAGAPVAALAWEGSALCLGRSLRSAEALAAPGSWLWLWPQRPADRQSFVCVSLALWQNASVRCAATFKKADGDTKIIWQVQRERWVRGRTGS